MTRQERRTAESVSALGWGGGGGSFLGGGAGGFFTFFFSGGLFFFSGGGWGLLLFSFFFSGGFFFFLLGGFSLLSLVLPFCGGGGVGVALFWGFFYFGGGWWGFSLSGSSVVSADDDGLLSVVSVDAQSCKVRARTSREARRHEKVGRCPRAFRLPTLAPARAPSARTQTDKPETAVRALARLVQFTRPPIGRDRKASRRSPPTATPIQSWVTRRSR